MSDIATEKILKSPLFHSQLFGNIQGFGCLKRCWQFEKELLLLLSELNTSNLRVHLLCRLAKIFGKSDGSFHRNKVNLVFISLGTRPTSHLDDETKANDIDFQLTVDSDKSFVGFGIAKLGMLLLPRIKSSFSIFGKRDNLRK